MYLKNHILFVLCFFLLSSTLYSEENSSFMNLDNWSFDGDIIGELRAFPEDDKDDHTKELTVDLSSHIKLKFKNDFLTYKFAVLGRYGILDKGRNAIVLEENYIKIPFDTISLTAGYQIHSWYILEGFRVSDILNSKNLDGDYEITEKYG
jgi:hypothetical protein